MTAWNLSARIFVIHFLCSVPDQRNDIAENIQDLLPLKCTCIHHLSRLSDTEVLRTPSNVLSLHAFFIFTNSPLIATLLVLEFFCFVCKCPMRRSDKRGRDSRE
jgi:hypothetical protein